MKKFLEQYFHYWWLPALIYICILMLLALMSLSEWRLLVILSQVGLGMGGLAFLGLFVVFLWNLSKRRWRLCLIHFGLIVGCSMATLYAFVMVLFAHIFFSSSEDGFSDHLQIPEGMEIFDPDSSPPRILNSETLKESDEFQRMIQEALAIRGSEVMEFAPSIPSLRKVSSAYFSDFLDYLDASSDWHVFTQRGNRFAVRRWSYDGEPRSTLHGYVSEFSGESKFQTRCLLCLDRQPWSEYSVQHVQEGDHFVKPRMTMGNGLRESRVMVECGEVWVEVFEQSRKPERRVTKATVLALEKEFSNFLKGPKEAVARAQARARELALRLASHDGDGFRLWAGMQPGMYGVSYTFNLGEPGVVYLKAFEVTKGTPLSVVRLKEASEVRMMWSKESSERFGAKAGLTIYEGDWGKPYAARFEVWFRPDSGEVERKLAERIFKIEGWQR